MIIKFCCWEFLWVEEIMQDYNTIMHIRTECISQLMNSWWMTSIFVSNGNTPSFMYRERICCILWFIKTFDGCDDNEFPSIQYYDREACLYSALQWPAYEPFQNISLQSQLSKLLMIWNFDVNSLISPDDLSWCLSQSEFTSILPLGGLFGISLLTNYRFDLENN